MPLYPSPMGHTTHRPSGWSSIDRRPLMQNAHGLARNARTHFASYREALSYGLRAAWMSAKSRQQIQSLSLQAAQTVPLTARQIQASRRATRRCGSSLWAS